MWGRCWKRDPCPVFRNCPRADITLPTFQGATHDGGRRESIALRPGYPPETAIRAAEAPGTLATAPTNRDRVEPRMRVTPVLRNNSIPSFPRN
jgi:hypothetical protein